MLTTELLIPPSIKPLSAAQHTGAENRASVPGYVELVNWDDAGGFIQMPAEVAYVWTYV